MIELNALIDISASASQWFRRAVPNDQDIPAFRRELVRARFYSAATPEDDYI